MIHDLKYQKRIDLAPILGRLAAEGLKDSRICDRSNDRRSWILVPVPLHRRRRREREFNQASEIAAELSRISGYSVKDVLRRKRYTTTQTQLERRERMKNLRGAFAVSRRRSLRGAKVILVDDVLTTGTTAHECARVLKEVAGVEMVVVVTVARG